MTSDDERDDNIRKARGFFAALACLGAGIGFLVAAGQTAVNILIGQSPWTAVVVDVVVAALIGLIGFTLYLVMLKEIER